MKIEEINKIIANGIEESGEKMYKEMTSDPIRKFMFQYACNKKLPF